MANKIESGGTFDSSKSGDMIGGTMASSMYKKGGNIESKYYITYANPKKGFDLYSTNGDEESEKYIGNYEKLSKANEVAKEKGLEKLPMYNRFKKGGSLKGNQKKLDVNKNGKLDAEDFKMLRSGKKMAKGGGMKDIGFENSNLYLYGFGKDSNGNTIVKVGFPNQRAFSIQTNGVLNFTHDKRGYKLNELDQEDVSKIEKEVVNYVKNYGSNEQKSRLKVYDKMEWGGTAESSETGTPIGGENESSSFENGGGVEGSSWCYSIGGL